jgi:hypothetical protein
VKKFRDGHTIADGNRILILGEDVDGKTDDLGPILIKTNDSFSKICGTYDTSFQSRLLGPLLAEEDEEEEAEDTKNNSSVIMRLDLKVQSVTRGRYLLGGDADVAVWERVWNRNKSTKERLEYDVLLAPHHCSWHSLSYDSWSKMGEKVKVSQDARNALGQARAGALVISSSKRVTDDDSDPPCIRAKREYEDILKPAKGEFRCVADGAGVEPMVIEVLAEGPKVKRIAAAATIAAGTGIGSQPLAHG